MSYRYNGKTFVSKELEKLIRKIHAIVGNAVTENRFIIFGAGSTQVLNAAAYALSLENTSSPARVVASVPYYGVWFITHAVFFLTQVCKLLSLI